MQTKTLLLAHHGTLGAQAAEKLAFDLAPPGTRIVHLFVTPDLWAGMQGDDWLNNASTRDTFGRYVEDMLHKEAAECLLALEARCRERGLDYAAEAVYGDPAECLLACAMKHQVDGVIIGPPRRKGEEGYRSRMDLDKLARGLKVPLTIAPRHD
jgi:hypothetical protein